MKCWLIILAILGSCLSTLGLAAPKGIVSNGRLLFEDVGPSDASIPSFSIEIGKIGKSIGTDEIARSQTDIHKIIKKPKQALE